MPWLALGLLIAGASAGIRNILLITGDPAKGVVTLEDVLEELVGEIRQENAAGVERAMRAAGVRFT